MSGKRYEVLRKPLKPKPYEWEGWRFHRCFDTREEAERYIKSTTHLDYYMVIRER